MKLRKEEEEIQKEMTRIRKKMDEERQKKATEELQYGFTSSHVYD